MAEEGVGGGARQERSVGKRGEAKASELGGGGAASGRVESAVECGL